MSEAKEYHGIDRVILSAVCGDSIDKFEYLLDWMAHAVQRPDDHCGVAIVIKGPPRSGKSLLAEYFASVYSVRDAGDVNYAVARVDWRDAGRSRFNAHMEHCRLLVADEPDSRIYSLISEANLVIEQQGADARLAPNRIRVVALTQTAWPDGDGRMDRRRFARYEVDPDPRHRMVEAIVNLRRMMDRRPDGQQLGDVLRAELLARDLSKFNVYQVPE